MKSRALLVVWLALAAPTMRAVIIAGTDGTTNTTVPGNGAPWDHVGTIGGATGVFLGDYGGGGWVITANHVGLGDFLLNGVTYTAVGGSGVQIGGADLFVFQISSSPLLPNLALSATAPSAGASVTMIGNGLNRDAPERFWSVDTNGNPSGGTSGNAWIWTPLLNATGANASGYDWGSGNTLRWGTNQITGTATFNSTSLLYTTFNAITGEAQGAVGDSGGGVFYQNGSTWELTGIIAYIGTENNQPGSTAVFGNVTDFADISVYRSAILTAIPEPAGTAAWCAGLAAALAVWRRRRDRAGAGNGA